MRILVARSGPFRIDVDVLVRFDLEGIEYDPWSKVLELRAHAGLIEFVLAGNGAGIEVVEFPDVFADAWTIWSMESSEWLVLQPEVLIRRQLEQCVAERTTLSAERVRELHALFSVRPVVLEPRT